IWGLIGVWVCCCARRAKLLSRPVCPAAAVAISLAPRSRSFRREESIGTECRSFVSITQNPLRALEDMRAAIEEDGYRGLPIAVVVPAVFIAFVLLDDGAGVGIEDQLAAPGIE